MGSGRGGGLARYTVAHDCSSLCKTNTMPNNACDHKVWSRFVITFCDQLLWSRFVITFCDHKHCIPLHAIVLLCAKQIQPSTIDAGFFDIVQTVNNCAQLFCIVFWLCICAHKLPDCLTLCAFVIFACARVRPAFQCASRRIFHTNHPTLHAVKQIKHNWKQWYTMTRN